MSSQATAPLLALSKGWFAELDKKLAKRGFDQTLKVEITNIDEAQAREFTRLFAWLNLLGGYGCSRQFQVSYDGDGAARAKITVNGEEVRPDKEDKDENDRANFDKLHFGFE